MGRKVGLKYGRFSQDLDSEANLPRVWNIELGVQRVCDSVLKTVLTDIVLKKVTKPDPLSNNKKQFPLGENGETRDLICLD